MNPKTILSMLGLAVVLGLISTARAEANSCSGPTFDAARAGADAVFRGTIVDQRFTVTQRGLFLFPTIEYEVAATQVWKGQASPRMFFTYDGRMGSGLRVGLPVLVASIPSRYELEHSYFFGICGHSTIVLLHHAAALDALGVPIATFTASTPPPTSSFKSWARRVQAMWVLGLTHFTSPDALLRELWFWYDWLFVAAFCGQIGAAIWLLKRRRFGRSLGLSMGAAATTILVALWTGHTLLGSYTYKHLQFL
jgi:hypothetical protein